MPGWSFLLPRFRPARTFFASRSVLVAAWGKPVAGELLIAGKSVGHIALGMPVDRMKNQLLASYVILKRKVLINDVYYDVYKILDQGNEPLLYVYEKDGKVWGISIISDAFKTAKGIGIGNSLEQMRINYPVIKLAYSEKRTPFVQVDDVAGIFIVQGEARKKDHLHPGRGFSGIRVDLIPGPFRRKGPYLIQPRSPVENKGT